jgi:glycosyltransferase involved in cell wall biosynthesis
MTVTNLHLTLTPFRNESRVLKETASIVAAGVADRVLIVALHENELPETEEIDGARRVVRLKLSSRPWPRNIAFQSFKFIELCWRLMRIARAERPSIINVHSLAALPAGVLLKLVFGGKLVYDAHELETETSGLSGLRKRLAKWLEWALIGFADLVVVVGPNIAEWYRRRYPRARVIAVLNAPRYRAPERTTLLRDALPIPPDLRIALFQGGLFADRGIEELLAAAPRLREAGHALVFMGYGPLQPQVEAATKRGGGVYFLPAVPPAEVVRYTASADAGLSPISGSSLSYRLSLPNKLFEHIMAGLPVLVSRLPEMERIVEKNGLGACVDKWDAPSILAGLAAIDAMRGPQLSQRLAAAAKEYSWDNQEAAMIFAYREMLGAAAAGTARG